MRATPLTGESTHLSVTGTSAGFDLVLGAWSHYLYSCTVSSCISQGAEPEAEVDDGSMFVPAGVPVMLSGKHGASVAAIRVGAVSGVATLTRVEVD